MRNVSYRCNATIRAGGAKYGREISLARLEALGRNAPRRARRPPPRSLALTASVGVVDGIHRYTADMRPPACGVGARHVTWRGSREVEVT